MKYTKYVFTYRRGIIIGIILTAGLFLGILAVRQSQEMRRKAAVPGGSAYLTLSPGSTTLPPNTSQEIFFTSSIQQNMIDGIQIVANITGDIPPDMQFIPSVPSEFRLITNTLESSGSGKILRLVFLTNQPQTPYANINPIQIGKLTFTSPGSGTLSIAFDQTLSKIMQNQEAQDVLQIPSDAIYTFLLPTPSAEPTLTPTPTALPTPATAFGYSASITEAGSAISAPPVIPNDVLTIEAWVKIPDFTTDDTRMIIDQWNTDYLANFSMLFQGSPSIRQGKGAVFTCVFTDGSATGFQVNSGNDESFTTNTWHHVACVRDGTNASLFIDGKFIAIAPYQGPSNFSPSKILRIGGNIMNPPETQLEGTIDELRISDNVRYTSAFTPPYSTPFETDGNTIGLYHFDMNLLDASGKGNNGSVIGTINYSQSDISIPPPVNSAPVFTTANTLPNATVNEAYKTEIAAEDPDLTDQLTMWLPDPLPGLSLTNCQTEQIENMNTIRCYLSGTPTQVGGYSPAMYVSDNVGHEVMNNQFSLQVVPKE